MCLSKVRKDFLSLVRLGINTNTSEPISADMDWLSLQALAEKQGLVGVVLDGIEKIPSKADSMPAQMKLEWIGQVLQSYEVRYEQYRKAINELSAYYNDHGIKMMVLKGYACALDWPVPKHRPCGDVDIWLFGKQKEADALLEGKGIKIEKDEHHHTVFYWKGFMIENHYDFLNVHHHKSNVEYEAMLKNLGKDDSYYIEDNGVKVYLPSPNLHALFLLRHMMSHFASTNISMRQLLDWGFFVKAHTHEIDWDLIENTVERFGMKRLYDVFNAICVGDLGFNVSIFPIVQFDPALKDRVMKEIVSPENYQKTPSNLLLRIPFKYRRWKENGWKHSLCFNDSMISAFWSGVKSHLLKPSSI